MRIKAMEKPQSNPEVQKAMQDEIYVLQLRISFLKRHMRFADNINILNVSNKSIVDAEIDIIEYKLESLSEKLEKIHRWKEKLY